MGLWGPMHPVLVPGSWLFGCWVVPGRGRARGPAPTRSWRGRLLGRVSLWRNWSVFHVGVVA